MALEGNILIGTPGSIPTPPSGEITRFLDTTYTPARLSYKDSTGAVYPFPADSLGVGEQCCCDIATDIASKISCAAESGVISMADYNAFIKQGTSVSASRVIDSNGNPSYIVSVSALYIPLTGLSVAPTTITSLPVNSSRVIVPTFTPANSTEKTLLWSTSNASTATVSAYGEVTGKAIGTCTITATNLSGTLTATCTVTVV